MICCEEDKVLITLPTAIPTGCFLHCCTFYGHDNELSEVVTPQPVSISFYVGGVEGVAETTPALKSLSCSCREKVQLSQQYQTERTGRDEE